MSTQRYNPFEDQFDSMSRLVGEVDVVVAEVQGLADLVITRDGMVVFVEGEQRPYEYWRASGWRPVDPDPEELRTAHKRANYVETQRLIYVERYEAVPTPLWIETMSREAVERIPGVVRPFQPTQFEGNSSQ